MGAAREAMRCDVAFPFLRPSTRRWRATALSRIMIMTSFLYLMLLIRLDLHSYERAL
jgi:hypothetical protein